MSSKRCTLVFLAALVMLAGAQCAWAYVYTGVSWVDNTLWSDPDNWDWAGPPDGIDQIVDFNQYEVPAGGQIINIDAGMGPGATVGTLVFGDTNAATVGGWIVNADSGMSLWMINSKAGWPGTPPTITVNNLNGQSVVINAPVSSSADLVNNFDGLIKDGIGRLVLNNNLYTGATTIYNGVLRLGNAPVAGAGSITIDQSYTAVPGQAPIVHCGVLEAAGAFGTVTAWKPFINAASTGAIGLTANSNEAISMAGYANLNLGATTNVTYSGVLIPNGTNYNLGGGNGTLAVTALANNGGPTTVTINGPVDLSGCANNTTGGLIIKNGDAEAEVAATNNADLGTLGTLSITFSGQPGYNYSPSIYDLGPQTQVNCLGGLLRIKNGGDLNDLTGHPIANPLTFSGGFDVDNGKTFTLGQSINNGSAGTSGTLKKAGAGTLVINANQTLGSIEIAGGTTNIGGTTIVTANGTGSGEKSGDNFNLRGNAGDIIHLNVSGTATINAGTFNAQYKNDNKTYVDVYDNAKISTQGYYLGDLSSSVWRDGSALNVTTLHNNAQLTATGGETAEQCLQIGMQGNGTLNMYDNSTVITDKVWMSQGGTWIRFWWNYAAQGYLNMYDNSTMTCTMAYGGTGNFITSDNRHDDGKINIAAVHVTDNARLIVGGYMRLGGETEYSSTSGEGTHVATFDGNALSGGAVANCAIAGDLQLNHGNSAFTSTFNVGGNATVTVGGDIALCPQGPEGGPQGGSGTVNVYGNGILTAAGNLTSGYYSDAPYNAPGYISVTGNGKLSIAGNATIVGGSTVSVSGGSGQITGALNLGDAESLTSNGYANVSGGTLSAGATTVNPGSTLTASGGSINLASLTSSGAVSTTLTGGLTVSGNTVLSTISSFVLDSSGLLSFKAITDDGTCTVEIGDAIVGVGHVNATATATSVMVNTIKVDPGSTLVIAADPSGPTAGLSMTAVPEPSTIVMLIIAVMGLSLAAWRRS